MRGFRLAIFVISLAMATWASRVSPRDGFFSVEAPAGWDLTQSADIFIWTSKDGHASITASLLDEQLTSAQVGEIIENRGFRKTTSSDKTFHGFPCFFVEGYSSSLDQQAVIYYCRVQRESQHWSVFLFYTVDSAYKRAYSPLLDQFLDSFTWDPDVRNNR
jgi:hypothetical protein